jgi:hypothetical protein
MRPALPERRSAERFPTALEGWFSCETTGSPIPCIVWDLSDTGVRLLIPPPADVPLEFDLRIPDAQAAARVRLVWTSGNHYGAQFTGSPLA